MGGRFRILVCLLVGALVLAPADVALAQPGTTTSAGDQQYIDPLANTTPTAAPAPATSSPAPPPAASSSAAPAPAPSTPSASATTTPSPDASSGTLPYTGLNLGWLVAIGLGLIAAGLALRRLARRA